MQTNNRQSPEREQWDRLMNKFNKRGLSEQGLRLMSIRWKAGENLTPEDYKQLLGENDETEPVAND